MDKFTVLFICMGNICRSPTAHAVFRDRVRQAGLADRVTVRSAGTHGYNTGDPPDRRSIRHAQRRGYDLSALRAMRLSAADLERADLVIVMDHDNLAAATELCPPGHAHKLALLTDHCRVHRAAYVPDPYYGDAPGFEHVLDLVEDACTGLLETVRLRLGA